MTICLECGKPLKAIGRNRKNGVDYYSRANNNYDWVKRKLHKKCWKQQRVRDEFELYVKQAKEQHEKNERAKLDFRNMFYPYFPDDSLDEFLRMESS